MQVSDYLSQYASTLANAASSAPQTGAAAADTAVQNLVSDLLELQAGTVFEGSINAVDGNKILLGMGNGQTISARLDGSLNLVPGQSVFFQVKSNDGSTIAIKPFGDGRSFNPAIQKALDAAGMEMTKDTIDMVNRMMEQGMPIDKNALASMRQTLVQNPLIPMDTAVMMTKLGIPVNDAMAAQFENYQNDRHAMLNQMEQVMEALPEAYAKAPGGASQLVQLNQQIITILQAGDGAPDGQPQAALFLEAGEQAQAAQDAQGPQAQQPQDGAAKETQAGPQLMPQQGPEAAASNGQPQAAAGTPQAAQDAQGPAQAQQPQDGGVKEAQAGQQQPQEVQGREQAGAGNEARLSDLMNKNETAQLEAQLKDVFPKAENFRLNTQLTAKEFLDSMAKMLQEQPPADKAALGRLFSGKQYHALLKQVMEQEWTLKPQDLKTEHKVEELYARLNRQMAQIEQLAKQTGMNAGQLSQSASQVRENIEFMHQINQAYTYVQIPLKLANQNAHSDLYVYTNKRNLKKREGELSAFLHLELENLGTTDVSIKMLDKNVSTKFYLEDDASYDLIEKYLPRLQERLEKLGYRCSISVENREEKVDFVEDFLQKSQPAKSASKGMVHRYSFDVRA